jgi:hypothetical protein
MHVLSPRPSTRSHEHTQSYLPSPATSSRKRCTISKATTQPPRNLSCVAYENGGVPPASVTRTEKCGIHKRTSKPSQLKRAHARPRKSNICTTRKGASSRKHAPIFSPASDHRYVVHEVTSLPQPGCRDRSNTVKRKGGTELLALSMQICMRRPRMAPGALSPWSIGCTLSEGYYFGTMWTFWGVILTCFSTSSRPSRVFSFLKVQAHVTLGDSFDGRTFHACTYLCNTLSCDI